MIATSPLPVSNRSALVDTSFVRLVRGCDADRVSAMVDDGTLRWVWNISPQPQAQGIRELRFWVNEILAPQMTARLELNETLNQILPPTRRFFRATELAQLLLVCRGTANRIIRQIGGIIQERSLRVERESLVRFLTQRWIGG